MTRDTLNLFCSCDDMRPNLQVPWTRDGYTYASDGRIAVRIPALADVPDVPTAPDAARLFAVWDADVEGREVVRLPDAADLPADAWVTCEECDGEAFVEARYEFRATHRCGEVTTLAADCPACDGEGRRMNRAMVSIGRWRMPARHLCALRAAGFAEILAKDGIVTAYAEHCDARAVVWVTQ